jgi:NADPH2:quinone reductase
MRAILVERPGGRDRLRLVERPVPAPAPGEVLIRVAYAAANWGDIQKRQGIYPDPVAYPAVLGAEVSGSVAGLGAGVRGVRTGQRVAAICGPGMLGGYADYVAVPAAYLLPLPAGLSLKVAATLPVAALTAYHLLHTAHRLRRGEVVLVHAIAGAVGLALTQIGRLGAATVIGTVGSAGKATLPRHYGARLVIDRSREDFVAAAMAFTRERGVDLVIDSLGGEILPRSFAALRPYGRLINIGEAAGEPDFPVRKKLYERSTSMAGFELLHAVPGSAAWQRAVRFVMGEAAAGRLRMPVAGVFPLADCAHMHEAFESRATSGKLLLEVGGPRGK